jgi:hypothetical protein
MGSDEPPPVEFIVIPPAEFVIVMLLPAVNVVRTKPTPVLPMSICPSVGAVDNPVPPLATATIPDTFPAVKPDAVPVKPVPAPVNDVALKTPVLGTNESFVDETVTGLFPVELVKIAGYQVVADVVLSVVATFVAFVAVPAVVADPAEPSIFTPVRDWALLERLRAIEVVPMYRLELPKTPVGIVPDSCPAGRLVRLAPDPLNPVAVKSPELGLKLYFVELTSVVDKLPVVWSANRG